ncbi:MAG: hypothetical protein AAGE76_00680 [Pseudomonadota bacterium]
MGNQASGAGGDPERLEQARAVYGALFRALRASLDKLEAGDESVGDAKHRQDLYRAHLRQFQQVFEIEGSLGTGSTQGAGAIDLDAARDEIRQRLARIRDRRGGDGVSG